MPTTAPIAAIDLGSNSFHLMVAERLNGHFKVIDRMREVVRIASGMDADGRLTDSAMMRALECLQRFGERVRDLPHEAVRAVGTNALRRAKNAAPFLKRAVAALGHPIYVVSGIEEARLIYLGVSHGIFEDPELKLVMDIGGGSTEIIIGRRAEPLVMESLHMGCVSMSERFFADGRFDAKRFRAAEIAARQEFEPIEESFREQGWQTAIGSSGSLLAIADALAARNLSPDGITPEGLRELRAAVISLGNVDQLGKLGVRDDRRPVFAGGLAITLAAFEELGIERMRVSQSALREGLLYDLMGRMHHEDARERTIGSLMQRFAVDRPQAERVAVTAHKLLAQVAAAWSLNSLEHQHLLEWAARVHEIGNSVSHSHYHKHGAYLLENLDMPGFSRDEQHHLAVLVRCHRRKIPLTEFSTVAERDVEDLKRLCVLLRLTVVLHRARRAGSLPNFALSVDKDTLKLSIPKRWLTAHALATADLEQEANYLKTIGYKLKLI